MIIIFMEYKEAIHNLELLILLDVSIITAKCTLIIKVGIQVDSYVLVVVVNYNQVVIYYITFL